MSTCHIPWLPPLHSMPTGKPISDKPFPPLSFTSHVAHSKLATQKPPPATSNHRNSSQINAFYAPGTVETFYEILGIPATGSTPSDIKKAYKQMARKHHPDASPPERLDENTRKFILVHEAYETLSNPQSKASYDNYLNSRDTSRRHHFNQGKETEWKARWESQLDGLNRRGQKSASWGARMRAQSAAQTNQ